jgi:membrane-associated phospholipid phosphatase
MNRIDVIGDALVEPLRQRKFFVVCFGIASTVGDFSIAWHIIGFTRALGSMERLWQAVALSVALGIESLIVNQGIKRMFRRERPTTSGDERFDIRTPRTSSFPSGHASSATFAVFILVSYTGFPLGLLWIALALVIAMSRVVVRIHHATDILGGIVTGAILGSIAVPVISAILG